jgi:lipid-binding SYLF domain-containing protein
VLEAGFLGSGRYGNGIVVVRLADGTCFVEFVIGLGGAGFGGQIGFELIDFVFVLNDAAAVRAFSQQGSLTLGGNVSLAAGPIGRNAEAAEAASLKGWLVCSVIRKQRGCSQVLRSKVLRSWRGEMRTRSFMAIASRQPS